MRVAEHEELGPHRFDVERTLLRERDLLLDRHEAALAIELGATVGDLAQTIHPHPTLPECLMEASEAVHKMAVHMFQKK